MANRDEVGVIVSYLFTLAIGLLYILIEDEHYAKPRRALISDDQQPIIDMSTHEDRRDADDGSWPVLQRNEPKPKFELYEPDWQYWPHSPLPEDEHYAKPRRALISDDQQPIIDMSTHEDRRDADDGSWPVLQRNEPKPKFELYEPDWQYWPHSPLPEKSTVYEKVRRISWITGICLLWPLLISVLIRISNPDEQGLPQHDLSPQRRLFSPHQSILRDRTAGSSDRGHLLGGIEGGANSA